jgi:hypothetical protein
VPTGKSPRLVSSSIIKNILLYRNSDLRYKPRRPAPTEGRFAIVTIRRARDAMDAAASGGVISAGRKRCNVRRNRVVLAPRPWRYADGSFPPATGARKAASPGRARISRKAIARGKPGCPGCTCQIRVHSFSTFSTRRCGRSQRPAFPAPSSKKRDNEIAKLGRKPAARLRSCVHFLRVAHPSRRRASAAPQDEGEQVSDPHGEEHGNAVRLEP